MINTSPHLICNTPLRVSLLGGGADFYKYIKKKPRYVFGMGINYSIHMNAYQMPGIIPKKSRFQYSKTEEFDKISEIEHPVIKAIMNKYGIRQGINVSIASDMPSGCGLGSSSAFTCGLINLINTFNYKTILNSELAYEAIDVEQRILKENVGIQDQILCALGGLRLLKLEENGFNHIFRNELYNKIYEKLKTRSFLVYTNISRSSSQIQEELDKDINKEKSIESISEISEYFVDQHSHHDDPWPLFSQCVRESWEIKRKFAITRNKLEIENIIDKSKESGAEFIKLLGAGGGGFIFCSVPEDKQEKFMNSFEENTVFKIEPSINGSSVNTIYS